MHGLGKLLTIPVMVVLSQAALADVRAGFATADLTPRLGVEMGGFGYNLGRTGDAIHDRLLARAAVIEAGGVRIAIIGCDLGGISLEVTQEVRKLISEATGMLPARILVGTTHTHSAPVVANWLGVGRPDGEYLREAPRRIASSVISAAAKLESVTVSYGEAPVEGVARNREYKDGPIDPNVRVLRFQRPGGRLAGFIANYSVHPVVMSERTRMFTGDVTGVAMNKVMEKNPGSVGIFLQGSCGDINPIHAHMPPDESLEKVELLAERLAGPTAAALDSAAPLEVKRVGMDAGMIDLPLVVPDKFDVLDRLQTAERLLKIPGLAEPVARELRYRAESARAVLARFERQPLTKKRTEIQAAVIGKLVIMPNPGETFLEFGRRAAGAFPNNKVMVTGYTNDYVGYIPAEDRYDLSENIVRYSAYLTPWINGEFRFRPDVGEVLVREMVRLAREVVGHN